MPWDEENHHCWCSSSKKSVTGPCRKRHIHCKVHTTWYHNRDESCIHCDEVEDRRDREARERRFKDEYQRKEDGKNRFYEQDTQGRFKDRSKVGAGWGTEPERNIPRRDYYNEPDRRLDGYDTNSQAPQYYYNYRSSLDSSRRGESERGEVELTRDHGRSTGRTSRRQNVETQNNTLNPSPPEYSNFLRRNSFPGDGSRESTTCSPPRSHAQRNRGPFGGPMGTIPAPRIRNDDQYDGMPRRSRNGSDRPDQDQGEEPHRRRQRRQRDEEYDKSGPSDYGRRCSGSGRGSGGQGGHGGSY